MHWVSYTGASRRSRMFSQGNAGHSGKNGAYVKEKPDIQDDTVPIESSEVCTFRLNLRAPVTSDIYRRAAANYFNVERLFWT